MEPAKQHLVDRFAQLFEQLYTEVRYRPPEESLDVELTMPQLRTLMLLRREPQRMGAIAEYSGIGLSSASSMIDRLVDQGLVERASDPDDRRVVTCSLTSKGRDEMDRFWRIERASCVDLANLLDLEDLKVVVRAVELLYQAGKRLGEDTAPAHGAP